MKILFTLAAICVLAIILLAVLRRPHTRSAVIPESPDRVPLAFPLRRGGWTQIYRPPVGFPAGSEERVLWLIKELARGDTDPTVFSPLPDTFSIRSVYRDGARLYVDVAQDAIAELSGGTEEEWVLLQSLKLTLQWNLPDVENLQILVDGQSRRTLGPAGEDAGHLNVLRPIPLK